MTTSQSRVTALCAAAGVTGAVALTTSLVVSQRPFGRSWLFPFFLVVLAVTYAKPLRLWHEGQAETLQLDEALIVPMALLLTPAEAMIAVGGSVLVGQLARRSGFWKTTFNVGVTTTAAGVGLLAGHLLAAPTGGAATARAVIAAVVAGLIFDALTTASVAGIIAVAQRQPFWPVLMDGGIVRFATYLGSLSLGVLVVLATATHHVVLFIVIAPVAVLHLAYAGALGQWRERRRTEDLYRAAKSIQDSIDSSQVRARLVEAARDLLGAGSAEVIGAGHPAPPGGLSVAVDEQVELVVSDRIGGGNWDVRDEDVLRALAGIASGALRNATLYEQLRVITSSLGEGVFAVDREGRTIFMNPAAERILGWTEDDLLGQSLHRGIGAASDELDCPIYAVLTAGVTVHDEDATFRCKDGRLLPVALTAAPVIHGGERTGAVVAFRDVTERKAFERELAHQAFHDALTGLPNRALFLDRLQHALVRSRKSQLGHALLFVDIDRFKVVNDSLGHQVGDQLLGAVAERLRTCLRQGDTLARFGGDEFTVLVEDIADVGEATRVADRIAAGLKAPFRLCERELVVSVSIGIASTAGRRQSADDLVAFSDIAMYRAKAKGGGCYDVYETDGEDRSMERLELEIALRRAIEQGELEVHYQPVVDVVTERVEGLEALVRWNHPSLGQVLPGGFISLAEETGLIISLGRHVLEEACRQTRTWQDERPDAPPLVISVNLSTRQLQRSGLVEEVADVLAISGLPAGQLCLEITESAMLEETPVATANLAALKRLGVRLAIDDFGTGYSSLTYLKRFPVDVVKIDRSFTSGMTTSTVDADIVTAVVQLAHAIGARAVAEGVETAEQLERLRAIGCPAAQGFYLSLPLPKHEIEAVLNERWAPVTKVVREVAT
ncbi:MAG: hypothetical protein QOG64_281 [Acidimicrobiaceae bacterium]|nr:hypothetical protein [Acidimicrobiaceae bacterium]